jgi:formyl-CoA transferase
MNGPIEGITVVEFGNFVAGPTAGQLLADLGANVIKIEPPMGEPWRHSSADTPKNEPGESRLFIALNRGKKSVCIDLKSEEGQKICHDIISKADAVISNNRTSTSEKLKYDWNSLSKVNPKLVYCESTAYGPLGAKSTEPGFDLIMQAYTGIMSTENKIYHGAPQAVKSSSYIDYSTGYAMALGVVSGVLQARSTGKGLLLQTSLLAQALSMQAMQIVEVEDALSVGQKWIKVEKDKLFENKVPFEEIQNDYSTQGGAPPIAQYYRAYKTKNGALALGCLAIHARKKISNLFEIEDVRFDLSRKFSLEELFNIGKDFESKMELVFLKKNTNDWITYLRSHDIPCEPMQFTEELVENKQAIDNGYIIELNHGTGSKVKSSGPVFNVSTGNAKLNSAPLLGENTSEVLLSIGYKEEQVNDLLSRGVIGKNL